MGDIDRYDWSVYMMAPSEAEVEDLSEDLLVKHTNKPEKELTNLGIFFTITPSDYYWKEKYGVQISEQAFRSQVIEELRQLGKYYKKNKQILMDIHIHFEKSNRLHSHGIITGMPVAYYPYEGELKRMSQRIHKVFGKPRLRSEICADFRWTGENWDGSYLVKQNYLKPCRLVY